MKLLLTGEYIINEKGNVVMWPEEVISIIQSLNKKEVEELKRGVDESRLNEIKANSKNRLNKIALDENGKKELEKYLYDDKFEFITTITVNQQGYVVGSYSPFSAYHVLCKKDECINLYNEIDKIIKEEIELISIRALKR